MRWNIFTFTVIVLVLFVGGLATENATLSEEDEDNGEYLSSLDELEHELEQQQPLNRPGRAQGWSPWSAWSPCSRTCDGGASSQLRRCQASSGCRGEGIRYKICNMQACPESGDFRAQQCAAYDQEPYEGAHMTWTPHHDESEPCALTCRGESSTGETVLTQLAARVQDGTRCRPGSLDMCINGKCQRVGCDLRIGSHKRVDACGVCGGDGSSCAQPLFHWEHTAASLCSATCGGGRKMSRPLCRNRVTGAEVNEQLCNASQKPPRTILPCNTQRCPAKWFADEWGACSVTCGGGSKFRRVNCAQDINGTRTQVADYQCRGTPPHHQEPCNSLDCPSWNAAQWSGCSVSCGSGFQTRLVSCVDANGEPSDLCDPNNRPSHKQPCHTGVICPGPIYRTGDIPEILPGQDHTQPLVMPYPPASATRDRSESPDARYSQVFQQGGSNSNVYFTTGKWSECSVTCGKGIHTRDVLCQIFLEFSETMATLPDAMCTGKRPHSKEPCILDPCSDDSRPSIPLGDGTQSHPGFHPDNTNVKVAPGRGRSGQSYSWKPQGFTHCSASCLGGVQESLISCVQDDNQKTVSPWLCDKETRPEVLVKTCNDHPCPPRWNYSDFQPCSKPCGIGIQTRDVTCIHEVTREGSNVVIVPNNMCPQPPPPDRQYCNILDCPIKWRTHNWSKCSKTCGGGIKTRNVVCEQVMAQNHVVSRPESSCPSAKPSDKKPCNTKSCVIESDRPIIDTANISYVQQNPNEKKVDLKIGMQAVVFAGTQIKIKCPVRRFNRSKIEWAKNSTHISNSKKYKISRKGALRIQDISYSDSGVYTCIAGRSSANIKISIKPKLATSSEEMERQNNNRIRDQSGLSDRNTPMAGTVSKIYLPNVEDNSHEWSVDSANKPGSTRTLRPTAPPSPPPPQPHGNYGEGEFSSANLPGIGTNRPPPASPPQVPDSLEDPPTTWSSSGGSRPMPHFQQLLANLQNVWPFQTFSNSRGHRMVTESMEHEHKSEEEDDDEDATEDELGPVVVLGKGSAENLKFDWMITDWSQCSQTCGGSGYQVRAAHCMVSLNNNTQNVASNLCEDAGLLTPPTIQKCGLEDCPRWVTTNWSLCEDSRCFTWNTAMQRREIACMLNNGTEVDIHLCSEAEKPTQRQECYNDKCKGTWKVGEWSECAASCEEQGIKYRILQCVWYGTKKPAGNACRDQPRPSVMKVCKGPPCAQLSECKDHSKYCQIVKTMKVCGMHRYQFQCCQSCRHKG